MAAPFINADLKGRVGEFAIDVDFEVPARGVTALIGPSGSGKTTVLRCIAGLTRLQGRVVVEGEVWQDQRHFRPAWRRPIGVVFQDASLLPHLTVRRNLEFGLKRTDAAHIIEFGEVVEMLGLGALLERAPANLSGGERQRVAIGRALLSQPRLLLMDEPLSSLDSAAKAEIAHYIERLHRTLAVPILYVSHDEAEVRRLADRLLVMDGGHMIEKVSGVQESGDARGRLSLDAAEAMLAAMEPGEIRLLALTAIQARLKPRR